MGVEEVSLGSEEVGGSLGLGGGGSATLLGWFYFAVLKKKKNLARWGSEGS